MTEPDSTTSDTDRPNTRQALLDAAEALFSDRGYEAVGIREIVDRAGANLAAIKYHFGSKGDLYNETIRHVLERSRKEGNIWDVLDGPNQTPLDAARALGRFIGLHGLSVFSGGASSVVARLFLLEATWPREAFDEVIEEHFKPCIIKIEKVIRTINSKIDDSEATTLTHSVMAPMAYQRFYRRIIDSTDSGRQPIHGHAIEIAATIASFVVRGVGGDDELAEAARVASTEAIYSTIQLSGDAPETENTTA